MIFFHRWFNKCTIHWQFITTYELWNSIIFLNFKASLVIALAPPLSPPPPPSPTQRHYPALRTKIDMWPPLTNFQFLFIQQNQDRFYLCPWTHELSKSISLIKKRIEYLTKALFALFSKIIMFFQFLLEKVSLRFENDYIQEIEYSWLVNIDITR